jgi:hypothetical protein
LVSLKQKNLKLKQKINEKINENKEKPLRFLVKDPSFTKLNFVVHKGFSFESFFKQLLYFFKK